MESFPFKIPVYIWSLGIVWFYAWVFNPQFTSGTVWFLAGTFASILSSLAWIEERVK